MNRCYSLLEVKSFDEDKREITGIASTPEPDRMGDVVNPEGAEYKLPLPLLWQHDSGQPIGEVYAAKATKSGIEIKARLARLSEPGRLSERLDEAWQSIKIGLVKGLSIGFKPVKFAFMDEGGLEFQKWEWLELSAVTIPANAQASIQTVKSVSSDLRAASGTSEAQKQKTAPADSGKPSGVSEKKHVIVKLSKESRADGQKTPAKINIGRKKQ